MINILKGLFHKATGLVAEDVVKLTGDGSNRSYYRMRSGDVSLISTVGVSAEENRAFFALSAQLAVRGIDVPVVMAISDDELCYVQNDLGDTNLYERMKQARERGCFDDGECADLCKVMSLLPDIQYLGAEDFDFTICYPVAAFDRRSVFWDLNYFKYCFLKAVGLEFNETQLEEEFERFATLLLTDDENTFMFRDFQSRNVMWHDARPYFIDFQGGRRGPIYYDVASFVGQARAKYTPEAVQRMIDAYLESLKRYRTVDKEDFMQKLLYFRLFRLLQNLGAYGFRGLLERKKAFVESIPAALQQVRDILSEIGGEFPVLEGLADAAMAMPLFVKQESSELTVDVMSFSYKRGIPDDYSGNGGGFVFDCRAIHNPGRYEPYKKLCGYDEPVIRFLEKESEIAAFLEGVYSLTDMMVANYIERGFKHIQICFGCTGGQHRSVYSAEHTARHIADKFGVKVIVTHKMQNRSYTIESKK